MTPEPTIAPLSRLRNRSRDGAAGPGEGSLRVEIVRTRRASDGGRFRDAARLVLTASGRI